MSRLRPLVAAFLAGLVWAPSLQAQGAYVPEEPGTLVASWPATPPTSSSAAPPGTPLVTLDEALLLASRHNPEIHASFAEVEEARARRITAGTYPFNPELSASRAKRTFPGGDSSDTGLELSQEIQLGGQRRHGREAAEADVAAAEARAVRVGQAVAARVALAFVDALHASEIARIEGIDVELTEAALDIARKRLAAGAGTDIEVNLAVAARARARRHQGQAEAMKEGARFVLAEALGVRAEEAPQPKGALPDVAPPGLELAALLDVARERRADLLALGHATKAAELRVRLARAGVAPNLRVAVFHESEGGTDDVTGLSLGMGLPFANRNRGAVLEARAAAERSSWEAAVLERSIERELAEAWVTLGSAAAAASTLETDVVGTLEDNLRLLRRSFEAGKIGAAEVLLFRREFLEAQVEHAESRAEASRAGVLLAFALGSLDLPPRTASPAEMTEVLP